VSSPAGTAAGAYYLLACADDLGVVAETNESNNCVASVRTTLLALPTADLAVTAVSDPPVAAVPGTSFLVTDTTLNVGPVSVPATTTRYVLSVDSVRSADDVVIGSRGMGALGAGGAAVGRAGRACGRWAGAWPRFRSGRRRRRTSCWRARTTPGRSWRPMRSTTAGRPRGRWRWRRRRRTPW